MIKKSTNLDFKLIEYSGETRLQMGYYPDKKRSIFDMVSYGEDGKEVLSYFYQVMAAVSIMHSKNIIHGDLKPENTCWNGQYLKLIDFGESIYDNRNHGSLNKKIQFYSKKRLEKQQENTKEEENEDEDERMILPKRKPKITLGHAAPEVLKGYYCTFSSDMYSLGVLVGRMLISSCSDWSDYHHFVSQKDMTMINRISNSIELPALGRLIEKLISEEPSKRLTSKEALFEFNEMLENSPKYFRIQMSLHKEFYSLCSNLIK